MADYKILKPFMLSFEGGYTVDSGGPTMSGVTLTTFRDVFGKSKNAYDLRRITDEQWDTIFLRKYWNRCRANDIKDQSVANMLVDFYFNAGSNATKKLQGILGTKVDGIIGSQTIKAINDMDAIELFLKLKKVRDDYYRELAKSAVYTKYLNGWLRRSNSIQYGSLIYNNYKIHTF